MLANNNKSVIRHMANRSLKSNRRKNGIILIAIILSTFMLFSVFTIGETYFKMLEIQNVRLNGADFDAIMYGMSPEQQEICNSNSDIAETGIVGLAGSVIETDADDTVNIGFIWVDHTFWNKMMEPAREWTKGEYPKNFNEIMVTEKALKACGMDDLGIGDSFPMVYRDVYGEHTKEFKISGMWNGYGSKNVIYVSEEFYKESGYDLASVGSGRYYINFNSKIITPEDQEMFIDSLNLGKQQHLFFNSEVRSSVLILLGMMGLVLITCFCAYLLIYNILYLSVSGNIRYYGLLQTVGMTGKQIYNLMKRQMLILGGLGIGVGLIAGCVVSFLIIPTVVQSLGIHTSMAGKDRIVLNPIVFVVTILLTSLTIYLGSRKPVKMAVNISPIEALGFRFVSPKKRNRKTSKRQVFYKMAVEQLTSDKKKTAIVILSLTISLSVFLCLVTLIESQGARTLVSNFMDNDMTIYNENMTKENRKEWAHSLDQEFLTDIESAEGVEAVYPFLSAEIIVPWEPDFADMWMEEFYAMWMEIPYEQGKEEYKRYPQNFASFIIGIEEEEFEFLNKTLDVPIIKDDFLRGKICVLNRGGLDITTEELGGKEVTFAEYNNTNNSRTIEIAGLTDESYYTAALRGYPPTIIVSANLVKDMMKKPFVYKVSINYEKEFDEATEARMLKQINKKHRDLSYVSKIEELHDVEKAQGNMMEIGIGIIIITGTMGILNYINTVFGNIQSRKMKLAILESLGMTDRQITKMLVIEGLLFSGISLLLTATVGMGITYALFQALNYRGVSFYIPVLPHLIMIIFIIVVCTGVPVIIRNMLGKEDSLVEKIKGFE